MYVHMTLVKSLTDQSGQLEGRSVEKDKERMDTGELFSKYIILIRNILTYPTTICGENISEK